MPGRSQFPQMTAAAPGSFESCRGHSAALGALGAGALGAGQRWFSVLPIADNTGEIARLADEIEGAAGEFSAFEQLHGFVSTP
jgi:hypothetical protein